MFSIGYYIALVFIGIFAGFASGLLGIGGGFLLVPLQYFLLSSSGVDLELAMMISLGTSLAIIIPTATSGAMEHKKKNPDIIGPGVLLGIFGIVGSFCGGFLATVLPSDILRFIFGILLFIVAIDMLVGFKREGEERISFTKGSAGALGLCIGILSGMLGIGGGIFLVSLLSLLFGFTLIRAIGTSSVFISITAVGGVLSYIISGFGVNPMPYSLGYISLINLFVILMFSLKFK